MLCIYGVENAHCISVVGIVAGLPDLARLVHGNSRSIQKLVREFCEYWRRKTLPDATAGDVGSDENAPVVKVSKRKAEAKIREIAVYEFRPQCYKRKLWYVNDTTIEKLNLSLPVPTEWKWITLASTKGTQENSPASATAKQPIGVSTVQPSPTTASSSIKSFMSAVTSTGSRQQSPAAKSVTATKASCGISQSPGQALQQSPSVTTSGVESANSASPACTSDTAADGTKLARLNPERPAASTPCSSTSSAKKRKVQSVRRICLPVKSQPCLLFSKKPPVASASNDDDVDDCVVADSCSVNVPNAAKPSDDLGTVGDASNVPTAAKPSDLSNVESTALQPADDDDCMIVDSCVHGNQSDADKGDAALAVGSVSDVCMISDEKSLPETDANCNVCVESSVNSADVPVRVNDCE